jgi:hypothetical protein
MAVTKILMRDVDWHINTGTPGSPVWVPIGGIDSATHAVTKNDADSTDVDSAGRLEHMTVSRGDAFTLTGRRLEDYSGGARDAGQAACEAAGATLGVNSVARQLRATSPGGHTMIALCSYKVTPFGGGHNDFASWECEATVTGAATWS